MPAANSEIKHVHFIGLGGAGMSALALILLQRGVRVSGSDLKESRQSNRLAKQGAEVFIGHDASNLGHPDVVVISTAIPEKNVELVAAREKGIEVWQRAKMLAYLAGEQKTVAVAGTHGKTSTSSMTAFVLKTMGAEPSFCIGGVVAGLEVNAESGQGDHYVVEADESDGSFLHLKPYLSILTNLEVDHLDHYASFDAIKAIFAEYALLTDEQGFILYNGSDEKLKNLLSNIDRRSISYGKSHDFDYSYEIGALEKLGHHFSFYKGSEKILDSYVALPGEHMVENATAVLAAADLLGLDLRAAGKALSEYSGVHRRFDFIDEVDGITIVDDYAHHPTEVEATLKGAAQLGFKRVIVAFQSHRYSRTQAFASDFAKSFGHADKVVLLEVYSAGETPIPGVSARTLLESILHAHPRTELAFMPRRSEVLDYLVHELKAGDLLITMGAGDVTAFGPELAQLLRQKSTELKEVS